MESAKTPLSRQTWPACVLVGAGILAVIYACFAMGLKYLRDPDARLFGAAQAVLVVGGVLAIVVGWILRLRLRSRG
ncbi:MAG: hypothetical protein WC749_13070 [Dehalococcoidia bacterium]